MPPPELPKFQDCHELWSKKRRKQIRDQQQQHPGGGPPGGPPGPSAVPPQPPPPQPQSATSGIPPLMPELAVARGNPMAGGGDAGGASGMAVASSASQPSSDKLNEDSNSMQG